MLIELKPAQQRILELAAKTGMTTDEVLDLAFSVIESHLQSEEWLLSKKDEIAAQIDEGFAQSERGEVYDPQEALRILKERRAQRQVA